MAKYTVNYTCGHSEEISLFGAEKQRKVTIERKERGICAACAAKAAAATAQAAGLPALTGSDKQISWATSIRREKLAQMEREAKAAAEIVEKMTANLANPEIIAQAMAKTGKTAEEVAAEVEQMIEKKQAVVDKYEAAKTETSAAWWIDHR